MKKFNVHSKIKDYSIILGNNIVELLDNNIDKNIRYFVIFDDKLNNEYAKKILSISPSSIIYKITGGESVKSLEVYQNIQEILINNSFSKKDELIAFGGGTITDLVGYLAATYKRGVEYINIPTTTLSMIDSSIGGKNGLNLNGVKNAIGTIYPPNKVLIGLDTLESLDKRNFNNGLFETIKIGMILDKELFNIFANNDELSSLEEILERSIKAKIKIVEEDEEDKSVRKILNYGHTFGHAIESYYNYTLLHGEAVMNGMLIINNGNNYYNVIKNIMLRMGCPTQQIKESDINGIMSVIINDKKSENDFVNTIKTNEIGSAYIEKTSFDELKGVLKDYVINNR